MDCLEPNGYFQVEQLFYVLARTGAEEKCGLLADS